MMHEDIQKIEAAARAAMSCVSEPARQETATLRLGLIVSAICILFLLSWLIV